MGCFSPAVTSTPASPSHRHGRRRGAAWLLISLLAGASVVLISACGGEADGPRDADAESAAAAGSPEAPTHASTHDPDWAPGETTGASTARSAGATAATPGAPAAHKPLRELWTADGRARITLPEDWPADLAARWSGQRYATRAQLERELIEVLPYTLVIDADDENALHTGLQCAETVSTFAGGKDTVGVFVRSRHPAIAARLAERLVAEQGWINVFVVI
jgi:hypothetical protein